MKKKKNCQSQRICLRDVGFSGSLMLQTYWQKSFWNECLISLIKKVVEKCENVQKNTLTNLVNLAFFFAQSS